MYEEAETKKVWQQIYKKRKEYRNGLPKQSPLRDFLRGFKRALKEGLVWDAGGTDRTKASEYKGRSVYEEYLGQRQRKSWGEYLEAKAKEGAKPKDDDKNKVFQETVETIQKEKKQGLIKTFNYEGRKWVVDTSDYEVSKPGCWMLPDYKLKKTKQKNGIPGEDLVSLPPIPPELDAWPGDSDFERLSKLVWQGYYTVIYAKKNQLSGQKKCQLFAAFQKECGNVLTLVGDIVKAVNSISNQDRFDLYKDYELLVRDLDNLISKSLCKDTAVNIWEFFSLSQHQLRLLQRCGVMSSIDIDMDAFVRALRRIDLAKSDKETQETAGTSVDKKATDTGRKKKQKKPQKNVKDRFSFAPGQILFDETDLKLPTGLPVEVLKKLIQNFGIAVGYGDLDENMSNGAADEQLRRAKKTINDRLKITHVPCQIVTKPREGYCLCETSSSKKPHKRATRKSH